MKDCASRSFCFWFWTFMTEGLPVPILILDLSFEIWSTDFWESMTVANDFLVFNVCWVLLSRFVSVPGIVAVFSLVDLPSFEMARSPWYPYLPFSPSNSSMFCLVRRSCDSVSMKVGLSIWELPARGDAKLRGVLDIPLFLFVKIQH